MFAFFEYMLRVAVRRAVAVAGAPARRTLVSMQTVPGVAAEDPHVHVLTLDDGKMNAFSFAMLAELNDALDACEHDRKAGALVLAGNARCFSAGFDLSVMGAGPSLAGTRMLELGGRLAFRLAGWHRPTVLAVPGHSLAFGAILLLAGDRRLGASDAPKAKIGLNEVAIGMPLPGSVVALARTRLAAPALTGMYTATLYSPAEAVAAGYLDAVVPTADLGATALATAQALAKLPNPAFITTKVLVASGTPSRSGV